LIGQNLRSDSYQFCYQFYPAVMLRSDSVLLAVVI